MSLKHVARSVAAVLPLAMLVESGIATHAQIAPQTCPPAAVIPLTGAEPAPRVFVGAPLPEPLSSRGVAVIPYCTHNMRIAPIFGPGALTVSPRVGHIHVTVDGATWRWADASGSPVILQGLSPGPHMVLIELVTANHQVVDKGIVRFDVPEPASAGPPLR
jgi:hypothetical protein